MYYYEIRFTDIPTAYLTASEFEVDHKSNEIVFWDRESFKKRKHVREVYSITRVFENPKIYNTVELE